jgi:hypothetical protein
MDEVLGVPDIAHQQVPGTDERAIGTRDEVRELPIIVRAHRQPPTN